MLALRYSVLVAASVVVIAGCSTPVSVPATVIHTPSPETVPTRAQQETLARAACCQYYVSSRDHATPVQKIKAWSLERDGLLLVLEDGMSERFPFESLRQVRVLDSPRRYAAGVEVGPDRVIWFTSDKPGDNTKFAIATADTLYDHYVRHSIAKDNAAFEAGFGQRQSQPPYTEAARRYSVQARAAIREKRFSDAAALYREASQVSPYWANARYNRALVLGELKHYREAIAEMQRYLKLEPHSPDRRAVQDRIYEWEAAMQTRRPAN